MTGTAGEAALSRQRPLSNGELSVLCGGLALVLRAGIPVAEGLELLAGEARDGRILESLRRRTEEGLPLSQAMAESRLFPAYVCDMAGVGEASGRLDGVMEALAAHYRREEAVARAVLELGTLLGRYSALLLVLVAVVGLGLVLLWTTRAGRRIRGRLLYALPLTRSLSGRVAAGRFASAMALTLQSGLDTGRCLELATRVADHPAMGRRIEACRQRMEEGASFADAALAAGLFTGLAARMVAVGSRTGALDSVMRELADRSGEEIDARVNALLSLLEPLLVAVLALVSGGILLSVMLPLLGVMSSLG